MHTDPRTILGPSRPVIAVALAAALYAVFYFLICGLPVSATPTFRIDYFAASVTGGDDFLKALIHARPVVTLFVYAQTVLADALDTEVRYVIYPLQHIALLVYFFSVAKALEWIFKVRLAIASLLIAWLLFILTPAVMEGVYKLETLVGTLSMLFGGLAMVFLVQWERGKGRGAAIAFLACYVASILAKEDFILPPLMFIAWCIVKDGDWKQQVLARKWVLAAIALSLVFFLVFNKAIIPGRAYIEPVKRADSAYFMTLDPASVIRVLRYYITDCGRNVALIFMMYGLASLASLLLRKHWKETILVAMIVAGLLAPYLIMPNHLYSYYGEKWLPWEAIASLIIVQSAFGARKRLAIAASCVIGAAILVPTFIGLYRHSDVLWFRAGYYREIFSVARNLHATLVANRDAINRHKQVAVVGIGPGEVEQSPWQGNGETEFYLSGDLKLNPQWILFVRAGGPSYRVDNEIQPDFAPQSRVIVKSIGELDHYKRLPALVFQKDGKGRLVDLDKVNALALTASPATYQVWTAGPNVHVAAVPHDVSTCGSRKQSRVQVTWDVSSSEGSGSIEIWVENGATRKLWLAGSRAGTAASGDWAKPGMRFQIEDAGTHRRLASVTIGGTCP